MPPELENQTEVIPTNQSEPPNPNQTPNPNPGPTNQGVEEVAALFQNVVREGNRREQLLREELTRLRESNSQPTPPASPEEAWTRFAANPEELIRKVVNEQTRELNATAAAMSRRAAYDTLINNSIASNPGFGQLYQAARIHIDGQMQSLEPSPENLANVVRSVVGAIALGEIKVNLPTNNPPPTNINPNPPNNVRPPNIPSSAPPLPSNNNQPKKHPRELTENERHLMRLRGWDEDRWWKEMAGSDHTEGQASSIIMTDKPRTA